MPPAKTHASSSRAPRKRTRPAAAPRAKLAPTLGPLICAWIERCLVHAEGDYFGQPFRLRGWQKALIYRAYELLPSGARRYKRVLWGFPKGNGKTELAAALACAEFAGPVVFEGWDATGRPRGKPRMSPDIPIGAASFEQADLLFGAARTMIKEGALRDLCEVYDTEVLLKGRPGRMYRVAAVAGTNDGKRPTFFIADELHEWTGNKERVHLVLSNGRAKRADSWELAISTAGWDAMSLLGRLYQHHRRIVAGEAEDPDFLCEWFEAPAELDLADPVQLRQAIVTANPAAGDFLPVDNVQARFGELPEFEFRRYHLNQWVSAPERWLPAGSWDGASRPDRRVADGEPVVLGFDGSWNGDSTAVVGCTMDGHLFVVDAWERPEAHRGDDWRVPVGDVEHAIRQACQRWQAKAVACDPHRWQRSISLLAEEGLPMVEWPSHQPTRMVQGCAQFYEGLTNGLLTHDGDTRLARHIANAVVRIDSRGPRITKDQKDSARHIDLAVAAIVAYDMSIRLRTADVGSVYEERGVTVLGGDEELFT